MYTREAFATQRAAAKRVDSREGRVLAAVAVGLGLGQLVVMRWLERHLAHPSAVTIEGGVFLAYLVLVVWLLARLRSRQRAVRPTCPQCGAVLEGISERIAAATGRCDACGGQVIEEAEAADPP